MKNSLFKRAFATVAAVPVALAQCLTIANAVEVTDADAPAVVAEGSSVITLNGENGLLYIAPADGYSYIGDGTYEKASDWNARVAGLISQAESGSIDASDIIAKAVAKSGRYKELAEMFADKIGVINYTVNASGDMIITAAVDNLAPAFEDKAQQFIDEAVKDVVIEYDQQQEVIDELKNTKFFSDVEIAGTFKAVIKTGALATGTTVTAEISFIDADGKEYKNIDDAKAYAAEKFEAVKTAAKSALQEVADKYDLSEEDIEKKIEESQEYKDLIERYSQPVTLTPEEVEAAVRVSDDYLGLVADLVEDGLSEDEAKAKVEESQDYKDLIVRYSQKEINLTAEEVVAAVKKSEDYKKKTDEIKADYAEQFGILTNKLNGTQDKIDEVVDKYAGYLTKAENGYEKAKDFAAEGSYANSAELLAAVKNRVAKTRYSRFANRVPASFEEGASKNIVGQIFTAVVNQINSTVSAFDIQVDAVEIGKYFDSFQNINGSVSGLVGEGSATYPDAESEAVKAYFVKEYAIDEDTFESYMEVNASADMTNIENGVVSVDFQLKRVVKAVPVVTTTTTTSTTTPTTTSTEVVVTTTSSKTPVETTTTTSETPIETTTTSSETPIETTTTSSETPIETTTTSSETPVETTTTSSETPVETTTTTVSSSDTPITTTTTQPILPAIGSERAATINSFTYGVTPGYYLNIDDEYDNDQVINIYVNITNQIVYKAENGEIVEIKNDGYETINLLDKFSFGNQKPSDVTTNSVMDAREITLYAAQDITNSYGVTIFKAGDVLADATGDAITVEAYVGVKGDIDFSGAADAIDASQVLAIYAKLQTDGANADDVQFSPSAAVTSASDVLDKFAAFLADVDAEGEARNHVNGKTYRSVTASDASYILSAYAHTQTGAEPNRQMWDNVLKGNTVSAN